MVLFARFLFFDENGESVDVFLYGFQNGFLGCYFDVLVVGYAKCEDSFVLFENMFQDSNGIESCHLIVLTRHLDHLEVVACRGGGAVRCCGGNIDSTEEYKHKLKKTIHNVLTNL